MPPLVKIELYGPLRLKAGQPGLSVEAGTLREALARLVRGLPALAGAITEHGLLHPSYRACLNGREFPSDPDHPLQPGDAILLVSADAGG